MEVVALSNGIFGSNNYIIADKGECAIIDSGVPVDEVLKVIKEKSLKVRFIILTHGHIDHIFYVDQLKKMTGAEICIHEDELSLYSDPSKNGIELFGFNNNLVLPKPDCVLKHGDKLTLGDTTLKIIHTPGHSPGCISILCGNNLFSGDTLFALSIGRTDFYGGNSQRLNQSIKQRLFNLDGDITVWPGHGPSTTINYERENNPYVQF